MMRGIFGRRPAPESRLLVPSALQGKKFGAQIRQPGRAGPAPMACDPRFTVALIFTAWFSTNLTINFYNK